MSNEIARIYAELDMLLDTRLATLELISEAIAERALFNGYHQREEDLFEGVDREEFRRLYKARDIQTLSKAKMTNAMFMIANLMNQLAEQCATRPFYKNAKLIVNFYPYDIPNAVLDEIRAMIYHRIKQVAEVQLINVPPIKLTPSYCKSQYGMMVMYNAEEWLNHHMKALERTPMPEVMLLTPALYHVRKPSPEELAKIVAESMHPLQAFEFMMAFFVELKLIDVREACMVSPRHTTPDESQKETPEAETPNGEMKGGPDAPVGTQEKLLMSITDFDDPSRTMEEVTIEKTEDGWKHVSTTPV